MANKQGTQRLLILLILVATLALTACTPKNRAEAFAISLAAQRRNRIESDLHRMQMERENALTPIKVEAQANVIWAGQWVIVGAAVALAGTLGYWVIGITRADVRRRELAAMLIPLDAGTLTYPVFVLETKRRRYLVNPNVVGGVVPLDRAIGHDPTLAALAAGVRLEVAGQRRLPKVIEAG